MERVTPSPGQTEVLSAEMVGVAGLELISNVTGEIATETIATANYWVDHITAPVKFARGMEMLQEKEYNIFLEVGAKPILLGMGRSVINPSTLSHSPLIKAGRNGSLWLPSLRTRKEDWQQILQTLGALYERGIKINWHNLNRESSYKKVALPTYPFQRQSYWLEKKNRSNNIEIKDFSSASSLGYYQIAWQLKATANNASLADNNSKSWLLFADRGGLGEKIYSQLQKQKQNCILISDRDTDLEKVLKENNAIDNIIYLWGLDDKNINSLAEIDRYRQENCTAVLNLVKALFKKSTNANIWLLTRGSQEIDNELKINSLASSFLWGFASAIAVEHPEYYGGIIDLDRKANELEADKIIELISNSEKEDRLILREDKIYVPRLVENKNIVNQNKNLKLYPDGAYLITGGLGALGLQIARWLTEKGAKNLILMGRSSPDNKARKIIAELEKLGTTVEIERGDVANLENVKKIINSRIKGIIHAAGILDDGVLQNQTTERFAKVIQPKVNGAWNLHLASRDIPLDFFVMFSSVASLIGSPGQGNYTTANAGLDAIARYRQGSNLPALSINWGAWANAGMAVDKGLKIAGLNLIDVDSAFVALEKLLGNNSTQVGVIDADWNRLSQQFTHLRNSNYFSELLTETETEETKQSAIFAELLATQPEERETYLRHYLQNAIATILQIEPANLATSDSLLDIGMDSLMVMEAINQLKTDLQLMLYPREFYEHPQIDSLATYLAAEFTSVNSKPLTVGVDRDAPPNSNRDTSLLPPAAFILSSPRSGSTLLRVMLAGHPNLSSPPELHLLPFATMQEREEELGISQLGEGLKRAFMNLKNIDAAASQKLVEKLIAENLSVKEVYGMLQQLAGDRLLVDKSPTYASNKETLERAETIFNKPKYIHLVRHPYSVIESFTRMRMDKLIGKGNANPHKLAESIWNDSNQNILDFAREIDSDRYYLVKYEELVMQPREIMTGVCDFLGVPFNSAVLTPYTGDRMTDGVYDNSMSLGDPNFRDRQKIDAKLGDKWREIKLPQVLGVYTQQIARQLNYQLLQEAENYNHLPMQETLLNIRGLRICLCTWGPEEGPIVLCLHGILEQGAAWSEVAIRLAQKGYRVIAPDLRGHGRSDRVGKGGSYNLVDFLGDIDAIVENLAGRAFTLVGHSLGSVLGAVFTTIRPQRIKNIVLVETILPTATEEEDTAKQLANQLDYLAAPPEHPVFPDVEAAADRLRQATPAISKSLAMLLAERITEPCEGGVRWRWEPLLRTRAGISFNGIGRSSYLALLKKIKVPITLIYGDNSNFNRQEDLQQQQAAMPNAKKVVVSGGHNLPLEAPSALAKIISSAVALTNKLIP